MTSLELPELPDGRLRIEGRHLSDALGRAVVLRGVNAGGRSKWTPFVPFDFEEDAFDETLARYMDRVASWGTSIVRMPFSWEAVEPERGRVDEAYLKRYRAMIDAAWARRMRVLVDFHQDLYATPFSGDGFPIWTLESIAHGPPRRDLPADQWFLSYMEAGGPVQRAFDRLWSNTDGLLDAFESMWRTMARRFGSHPGVIGFEIINEPGWGSLDLEDFEARVLPGVLERVGRTILEEAKDAIVFGGGPGTDALTATTSMKNPDLVRFGYAPHYYDVIVNTGGPYTSPTKVKGDLARLCEIGARWNRPVLFGEFGASRSSPDHLSYLRDVYDALDRDQAHGTLWEASFARESWNHEDFGVTREDGSEHPSVDELVRACPRAIDGTIDRFLWDAREKRFTLEVSNAGPIVSEIFLPTRHLGDAPRIVANGAETSFRSQDGTLLVRASDERWSLVVTR